MELLDKSLSGEANFHLHSHAELVDDVNTDEHPEARKIRIKQRELSKYGISNPAQKARDDITAVLKILIRCSNYNNLKLGNTNELILLPQYNIIGMCCTILSSLDCDRLEPVFYTCILCLKAFSQDGFRVKGQFIIGNVGSILLEELSRTKEGYNGNCLELKYILDCLEIIRNISVTMSMESALTNYFPLYREHVMRVLRIWPEYTSYVNDILWCMAKVCIVHSKTETGTGGMEQLEDEINALRNANINLDVSNSMTASKGNLRTGALLRSNIQYVPYEYGSPGKDDTGSTSHSPIRSRSASKSRNDSASTSPVVSKRKS